MTGFTTVPLGAASAVTAPDGSVVRPLARLAGGSMARFELAPGQVSRAVAHRTVEELWHVVAGRGELWRRQGGREEVVTLEPGVTATIPLGTAFQFRAAIDVPLLIVAATLPPWPGDEEAVETTGPWAVCCVPAPCARVDASIKS